MSKRNEEVGWSKSRRMCWNSFGWTERSTNKTKTTFQFLSHGEKWSPEIGPWQQQAQQQQHQLQNKTGILNQNWRKATTTNVSLFLSSPFTSGAHRCQPEQSLHPSQIWSLSNVPLFEASWCCNSRRQMMLTGCFFPSWRVNHFFVSVLLSIGSTISLVRKIWLGLNRNQIWFHCRPSFVRPNYFKVFARFCQIGIGPGPFQTWHKGDSQDFLVSVIGQLHSRQKKLSLVQPRLWRS